MTYGDAIEYLVNTGNAYKAIMDLSQMYLSQYADALMADMKRDVDELKAEKRTVKRFLESNLVTDQKLDAIGTLLEEEA